MPAIPESIIESVKANTSILTVLKDYDIQVKKKGRGYFAICPFHSNGNEKNPSLSIDPVKNLYHCFSCEARGNVIQLVQSLENIGFRESVNKLLSIKPLDDTVIAAKRKSIDKSYEISFEERQIILQQVIKDSKESLRNSKAGRAYLESRGLNPLELLKHYDIGFWNGLYRELNSKDKKKLEACGFINANKMLFKSCVIFPLHKSGAVTTVYGRKVGGDGHYMLPGKREGLFLSHNGLNFNKPVVLTESIIDALSLFAAGITNVLPLLGTNGFLPDHLYYIKNNAFPKIFIALNGDEPGNRAAAQLKANLQSESLESEIIQLPKDKDINDMLLKMGGNKLKEWFSKHVEKQVHTSFDVWEDEENLYFTTPQREYRIRGLSTFGMDRLRVNIKAYKLNQKHLFYIDTIDLYQSRSREFFINQVCETLKVKREDIQQDISRLITVLEEQRQLKKKEKLMPVVPEMTDKERQEALDYLKSPNLLERIQKDFASCGMVGNVKNNLLTYLGSLSRLIEQPFGVLIVSRSGAGKSYLQDMVSSFVPEENLMQLTRLTGQSLFYLSKHGLKHKLLTIEEDEGMQDAMYSIRTLLSSQKLRLHGLKTDTKSGEFTSLEKVVEGPASVIISTTDLSNFDHETVNRFFVLFLDESREQTIRILEYQKRMSGIEKLKLNVRRIKLQKLHRNIQRLLKPVNVVNNIGTSVNYPASILNTRRENMKVESLINTIALLHQYQRQIKEERFFNGISRYIEVKQSDIKVVHELAGETLVQSLDELSPLSRELLMEIHTLVDQRYKALVKEFPELTRWQTTFTRKELRDKTGWSNWHLRQHIIELVELGYIVPRFGRQGQKYAYGLVVDDIKSPPNLFKKRKNH